MDRKFRAPWDFRLSVMTTGISAVLIGLILLGPGDIPTLIIWIIFFLVAAYGVYGYHIKNGKLQVMRFGWSKDYSLDNITRVEIMPDVLADSETSWGMIGLFGYYGHYNNTALGSYRAYATSSDRSVLVELGDERIVVTPENPDDFVQSLREAIEQ